MSTQPMSGEIRAGDRRIGQQELMQRAKCAASAMLSAGLQEGDSVAVILRNDFAFLEVMFAANLIGVYVAPVNWHANADEAAHIVEDSGAKLLVVHADLYDKFSVAMGDGIAIKQVATPHEIEVAYRWHQARF